MILEFSVGTWVDKNYCINKVLESCSLSTFLTTKDKRMTWSGNESG